MLLFRTPCRLVKVNNRFLGSLRGLCLTGCVRPLIGATITHQARPMSVVGSLLSRCGQTTPTTSCFESTPGTVPSSTSPHLSAPRDIAVSQSFPENGFVFKSPVAPHHFFKPVSRSGGGVRVGELSTGLRVSIGDCYFFLGTFLGTFPEGTFPENGPETMEDSQLLSA